MAEALVIVLHERRFFREAAVFTRYMRDVAGVPVTVRTVRNGGTGRIRGAVSAFCADDADDVRLLAYFGHGELGSWVTTAGEEILRYTELTRYLSAAPGSVFIINDCCHADSLSFTLDVQNADASRHGAICASAFMETAWLHMLTELIKARWTQRMTVPAGTAYNWGNDFTLWYPEEERDRWSGLRDALSRLKTRVRARLAEYRGRCVLKQTISRWGAVLDHHFFPRD